MIFPHLQEWLDSGVSPEIIETNVQGLRGQAALEFLTENAIAKVQKVGSHITVPARKILDRYSHILDGDGGWLVTGLDPLNDWERMTWGQVKPNTPKLKDNGKPQKYHGPEGVETRAIFLEVPSEPNFWQNALSNPAIPIYLLEGAKKAGLLVTHHYVAIALPGIWNGIRRDGNGGHYLIPELVPFAVPGRQFIFVYDQDTTPDTRKQVIAAQWVMAEVLRRLHGCECLTTVWDPSEGKGIDDVFGNRGAGRVAAILNQPQPLQRPLHPGEPDPEEYNVHCDRLTEQWQAEQGITRQRKIDKFREETAQFQEWANRLDLAPTLIVRDRYLPVGTLPSEPGLVQVDARMGQGKTASYGKGLVENQARRFPDGKFIMLGPRNPLLRQTVALYGGKHHTEYDSVEEMLSDRWWVGCYDSIWKFDPARVTPGSILYLDEISQGFDHLLNGDTVRDKRVFIANRFKDLARAVVDRGGWIVASEDGITNLEFDLLKEIAGAVPVTLVKSDWKTDTPWKIDLYDSPSLTWEEILIRLEKGEDIIVCSDVAKWLRELERWLIDNHYLNPDEIWVRDGDSTNEPWAKAFDRDPDQWIRQHRPRIFMYSPALQSGVSITVPHFDAMAIHLVNLQPKISRQLPARYRLPIPRFGYVKESATAHDESCKSFNPDAIIHDLNKTTQGIAQLTEVAEFVAKKQAEQTGEPVDLSGTLAKMLSGDDPEEAFWLKHSARYKARENYGKANLRKTLIQDWQAAGHIVTYTELGTNKVLQEERREIRKTLDREESVRFAETDATNITTQEARETLDKPGSTPDERRKARKRLRIEQLPGCDLDNPDFVFKTLIQDRGKFLKSTELLWAVQNPELQRQIDRADLYGKIQRQARRGEIVWRPDIKSKAIQADLIARSPLMDCLTDLAYSEDSEHVQRFKEWTLWNKAEIKRVLRLTVKDDHSGCKILNKFLRKLGYELSESKKGARGEQVRWYRISNLHDLDRDVILKALSERFKRRSQSSPEMYDADTVSVTCTNKKLLQVTDTVTLLNDLDSLLDIGNLWCAAETDDERAAIKTIYPPEVLQKAISLRYQPRTA